MERGEKVAENLRSLYVYMLARLTYANAANDAHAVGEVSELVRKIKSSWDQIVAEQR
jgi:flagellar protein FliS